MQRGKTAVRALSLLSKCLPELSRIQIPRRIVHPSFIRHLSLTSHTMSYSFVERGCLNSKDYRVFVTDSEGKPISPFHDIPLFSNEAKKEINMLVEISRWSNHKMEISKEDDLNPIKQDIKKGKVRFVKNCFPHHGYIWNYGAIPQTWEDLDHTEPSTGTNGDNDPLDVCEIGQTVHARGSIIQVKILGIMCLVDEGETDWKVIAIDVNDPLAEELNDMFTCSVLDACLFLYATSVAPDQVCSLREARTFLREWAAYIDDVEKHMPGFIKATREWFTVYKIPDGKPANKFAYNGEAKNQEFALRVIEETHQQWQKLVSAEDANRGEISCKNTNVAGSPYKIETEAAKEIVLKSAPVGPVDTLPDDVDKWHYIPPSAL